MNLEELQRHFDKVMHQQNNQGISDFDGYSPYEMTQILYFTFEPASPLKLQKLSVSDYQKIPILNQVKYLNQQAIPRSRAKKVYDLFTNRVQNEN